MIFEFSTSEVGLVKYPYDEQLALISAFLARLLVSESVTLDTTFGYRKPGASREVSQKFSFTCECCVAKLWNAVFMPSPGNHRSNALVLWSGLLLFYSLNLTQK